MAALTGAMSTVIAAVAPWPWPMIATFVGVATLGAVLHVNFIRPIRRRRKLRQPVKSLFVIPARRHHGCDFASQNEDEHLLKTVVLPANSEIIVDLRFEPRVFFTNAEIVVGCEGDPSTVPHGTEYFNRFIEAGEGKQIVPGSGNLHYIDKHGFYHVRETPRQWSRGTFRAMAFKFKTQKPGKYQLDIYFMGDEVEGKSTNLQITVEDRPTTIMHCTALLENIGANRAEGTFSRLRR
jgi:hypothetical protein